MSKNKSTTKSKGASKPTAKIATPKAPRSIQGESGGKVEPNATPVPDAPAAAQNAAKRPASTKPNTKASSKPAPKASLKVRTRTKVSALDAAAQVLASSKVPMRATDLIAEMASRGLWKSPGGKTPESTLYAAMIREIATKGDAARFKKQERGMFVANAKNG